MSGDKLNFRPPSATRAELESFDCVVHDAFCNLTRLGLSDAEWAHA